MQPATRPMLHLAGQKIRAWRKAHGFSSAEAFGEEYSIPAQTVYGWERRGAQASIEYAIKLQELGVCELADWLEPAKLAA